MKRYELEAMSKDDLFEHAKVIGVEISENDKKMTMVDKILGEFVAETTIRPTIEKSSIKKQVDRNPPPINALYDLTGKRINGKKYKVKIFSTDSDKSDVHLIVNGYNVVVKRNVEVILDEAYVEVLRNSMIETVIHDPDTNIKIPQTIQVYPHQAIPV